MKVKELKKEDVLSLALGEYIEYCDGIREIQFREVICAAFDTLYIPRTPFWTSLQKHGFLFGGGHYFLDEMK
jgi:hypothetical protein